MTLPHPNEFHFKLHIHYIVKWHNDTNIIWMKMQKKKELVVQYIKSIFSLKQAQLLNHLISTPNQCTTLLYTHNSILMTWLTVDVTCGVCYLPYFKIILLIYYYYLSLILRGCIVSCLLTGNIELWSVTR